jgi:hypothetical protein
MRTRILPTSSVRQSAKPVSPSCRVVGCFDQSIT